MKPFRYQPPSLTVPGTTEDILAFLDRHGTRNKDADLSGPAETTRPKIERRKGGTLRQTLDLHGLTSDEASRQIRMTMASCSERHIGELLIIHGKGHHSTVNERPVLKNLVREMLDNELRLSVRSFRSGLPREGGDGVTIAFLK